MSKNLQTLLRDALLNNSYDYDVMHNTLKKTWMNSYSYLHERQRASVEYEEIFLYSNDEESRNSKKIGHLYLDNLLYANFNIDYDLIHVYIREEFRRSKFYHETFTIQDMMDNPDIFTKIPIVIIDDQVIWDYKMKITKDDTIFVLPFKRNFVLEDERDPVTDKVIYKEHKIQVLVVDNCYYQRITLNRNNLFVKVSDGTFKIDKHYLKYNKTHDGIMMCSIHFPNEAGRGYELGTSQIPLEYDGESYYIAKNVPTELLNKIYSYRKNFFVSIYFVERLYKHSFYNGNDYTVATDNGTDLLVLEESNYVPYKSPIPVVDFMVFKTDFETKKRYVVKNSEVLELHYPNIYKIIDPEMKAGDKYELFYFYHQEPDLHYTVLFDFYFMYLMNKFDQIPMEKLINDIYYNRAEYGEYTEDQIEKFKESFQKIFDYQYYKHQYGEADFLYRFININGKEEHEPIEYKDETLRDWMKVQPWILNQYVLDQKKLGHSYHLFTNTIDLSSRIRKNTHEEMKDHSREFEEERYVFAFNNRKDFPTLLEARLFVDGIMVVDIYQERKYFMDYFYIPKDMVTEDSYIEIEVFPAYIHKEEVMFTDVNQTHEISLLDKDDDIFPTIADVYYEHWDEELNLPIRYDAKFFDITEHYERGDFIAETVEKEKPVRFTRITNFTIKPNSHVVLNIPLTFTINKLPNCLEVYIDKNGYPYMEIIERFFNFHREYIRVFKNGRILPRIKWGFYSSFSTPRLMIYEWCEKGDIIYIDITPYRYKEIYYQEEVDFDHLIIDLRNVITKPFDIRYYDVYLNGRKLSLNNVFSVSPWELTLVNLKSKYNLLIYEKERDYEYFGLDYKEHLYYYNIDDLFNGGFISEAEKRKLIVDIINWKKDKRLNIYPNENIEERQDYTDTRQYAEIYIFYFYELIPKTFVNPDVRQFNSDIMMNDYNTVYENYCRRAIETAYDKMEEERKKDYIEAICLDPDVEIKGEYIWDIEYSKYLKSEYVYTVGHLSRVPNDILDMKVEQMYDTHFDLDKPNKVPPVIEEKDEWGD